MIQRHPLLKGWWKQELPAAIGYGGLYQTHPIVHPTPAFNTAPKF
jgi:hypothetical protein